MTQHDKKLNIAMAGGGTGGHVFPIKSLIQHLFKHPQFSSQIRQIYWFGSAHSLEEKAAASLPCAFIPILSGKYRRETPLLSRLRNIRDLFLFVIWIVQALYYLIAKKIDVIFCKGGYVALPVVIAGWMLKKKIIVHESDTHSGLVNRIAARFATKVFTGFDKVLPGAETVGQILSDDIVHSWSIGPRFKDIFSKIGTSKTMVLVIGGSQGSYRLYKSLLNVLASDPDTMSKFVFFVSLWVLNNDLRPEFERFSNIFVFDFLTQQEVGTICHYADIALTRAGTTSLAEQKLYDMKLFMVPISWTHDQYDNAKYYVQHHQDLLLDQKKPDFEEQMAQAFRQHVWFHKKHKHKVLAGGKDILDTITQAKNKIASAILY